MRARYEIVSDREVVARFPCHAAHCCTDPHRHVYTYVLFDHDSYVRVQGYTGKFERVCGGLLNTGNPLQTFGDKPLIDVIKREYRSQMRWHNKRQKEANRSQ